MVPGISCRCCSSDTKKGTEINCSEQNSGRVGRGIGAISVWCLVLAVGVAAAEKRGEYGTRYN